MFFVGIGLMVYPGFSDWWNSFHQSQAISDYSYQVEHLKKEEREQMYMEARAYNRNLGENGNCFHMSPAEEEVYDNLLNINGSGMMAYLEIPQIKIKLPVYHGTEETVLQKAVGHIKGSSLPVGGESSHCILSGHRGLPSARLFSELDQLKKGDYFVLRVLDRELIYRVYDIRVVLPEETKTVFIEKGKDLCTLVTCTPYGVNSHRLLVKGCKVEQKNIEMKRAVENVEKEKKESSRMWMVIVMAAILVFGVFGKKVNADLKQNEKELRLKFEAGEAEFFLYQMAEWTENGTLIPSEGFEIVDFDREGLLEEELYFMTDMLKQHIDDNQIEPLRQGKTDKKGRLSWSGLKSGRYLLIGSEYRYKERKISPVPAMFDLLENDEVKTVEVKYEMEKDAQKIPEGILPQTGQLWWPVILFIPIGILLLLLGKKLR